VIILLKPLDNEKMTKIADEMGINKEECDVIVTKYLETHFDYRLLENIDRKFKIAKKAIEMIPKNGVVILDSGTTVLQIAKLLNFKRDLVIITNSLIAAEVLENSKNQIIVTGGELEDKTMSFVGEFTTQVLEKVRADIAFMGCDGFHMEGPSSRSYKELEVKRKIIQNSKKVALVTDSSKFNIEGLYRFATFDEITDLITDKTIKINQLEIIPSEIEVSIV
jgi:Transcriptional regulators of sugar metabolism